jgi:pimeloyl-ACP methyl ester carboxylesterase
MAAAPEGDVRVRKGGKKGSSRRKDRTVQFVSMEETPIEVTDPNRGLDRFATDQDAFVVLKTFKKTAKGTKKRPETDIQRDVDILCDFLESLPDGSCLPVRGRDRLDAGFDEWDSGMALKSGSNLWFLYGSGDLEGFPIRRINFVHLVQFTAARSGSPQSGRTQIEDDVEEDDASNRHRDCPAHADVVVISHGWSEEVGPDYPLIRTLEMMTVRCGWRAVVPDYRPTYRYGSARGRSERVRALYEELICLSGEECRCEQRGDVQRRRRVVLVGHSQGGAASAFACTDRVVQAGNIVGLLMLGSENPRALDGMGWAPSPARTLIVHAEGDGVISSGELADVAKAWGCQFVELQSSVRARQRDWEGDDINHDFLSRDLMESCMQLFEEFLNDCKGRA